MTNEQRSLVMGALVMLERQVREARQEVEGGAPYYRVRELIATAAKMGSQVSRTIDELLGMKQARPKAPWRAKHLPLGLTKGGVR